VVEVHDDREARAALEDADAALLAVEPRFLRDLYAWKPCGPWRVTGLGEQGRQGEDGVREPDPDDARFEVCVWVAAGIVLRATSHSCELASFHARSERSLTTRQLGNRLDSSG
jgi:hypothetical protein